MKFYSKTYFVFFLLILISPSLQSQQINWIVDTIYHGFSEMKERVILYAEGKNSVLIDEQEVRSFTPITQIRQPSFEEYALAEIQGKTYWLKEDLTLVPEEGMDFSLGRLDHSGQHLAMQPPYIVYKYNDSIFVENVEDPGKTFVAEDGYPFLKNDSYLWIKEVGYQEHDAIYLLRQKQLQELSKNFMIYNTENRHFLISRSYQPNGDIYLHVKDLQMNDIITPEEGYEDFSVSRDGAAFYGNRRPLKAFYKNEPMELSSEIIEMTNKKKTDLWRVETKKGTEGIINSSGKLLYRANYDNIDIGEFSKTVTLRKQGLCIITDNQGHLIFEAPYDDMRRLFDNRYAVYQNHRWGVIDTNQNIIIPFSRVDGFFKRQEYPGGPEHIYTRQSNNHVFYNTDGQIVAQWEQQDEETCFRFSKYFTPCYSPRILQQLTKEQRSMFNKHDVYIEYLNEGGKSKRRFVKFDGTPLSTSFKVIYETPIEDVYVIQTHRSRYGVVRIGS